MYLSNHLTFQTGIWLNVTREETRRFLLATIDQDLARNISFEQWGAWNHLINYKKHHKHKQKIKSTSNSNSNSSSKSTKSVNNYFLSSTENYFRQHEDHTSTHSNSRYPRSRNIYQCCFSPGFQSRISPSPQSIGCRKEESHYKRKEGSGSLEAELQPVSYRLEKSHRRKLSLSKSNNAGEGFTFLW